MESDLQKQLRIKNGTLRRILKEHQLYREEEQQFRAKQLELETQQEPDLLKIKKHQELLDETLQVLPGTKSRLQDAYNDLVSWMAENSDNILVKDTEGKSKADEILQAARDYLEQLNQLSEGSN